jgi:hypothetical protein
MKEKEMKRALERELHKVGTNNIINDYINVPVYIDYLDCSHTLTSSYN